MNKPQSVSSAGVLRSLQDRFNPSSFFAPWKEQEKQRLEGEWSKQNGRKSGRSRRKINNLQVKLGHGGTLDPLATGVLIVGVGGGTKSLNSFLSCTKQYETVVVFGAATDSYDVVGKLVAQAPYEHIKKETVEEALEQFRGNIKQKPPIFSALKVNGKPLYEYARAGQEIPREIEERPVEVLDIELLDWLDAGSHDFKQPAGEAEEAIKAAAEKILDLPQQPSTNGIDTAKRKREDSVDELVTAAPDTKRQKDDAGEEPTMAGALPPEATAASKGTRGDVIATTEAKDKPKDLADLSQLATAPGPAVRIRITVSSGFYVRSLAHDLGRAVGSLGYMAALVRSRQGDFELGKNVLEVSDFEQSENQWAPKLQPLLESWNSRSKDQ